MEGCEGEGQLCDYGFILCSIGCGVDEGLEY